jgi:hypothetical protein
VFVTYYEDRESGLVQNEKPDSWDSDATVHSISSARSYHPSEDESADEYCDEYNNISTVRQNGTEATDPDPKGVKLQHAVGPLEARRHRHGWLVKRRQAWNLGLPLSAELRNVPVPHGAAYCNADCLYDDDVPQECGYYPSHGRTFSCAQRCPGAWCRHPRSKGESIILRS